MNQGQERLLRILMVDDDQIDRRNVQRAVREAAMGSVEAENGARGAPHLADATVGPNCICLDYHVPGNDALELLDDLPPCTRPCRDAHRCLRG